MVLSVSCSKDDRNLESNAEIIGFTPEKCWCCWGWTIRIGNDLIKSDNIIIGEVVGYKITDPVKVYIELGELKTECPDPGLIMVPFSNLDYYDIERIEVR